MAYRVKSVSSPAAAATRKPSVRERSMTVMSCAGSAATSFVTPWCEARNRDAMNSNIPLRMARYRCRARLSSSRRSNAKTRPMLQTAAAGSARFPDALPNR